MCVYVCCVHVHVYVYAYLYVHAHVHVHVHVHVHLHVYVYVMLQSFSPMYRPGGRLNKKDGLTRYGNSHVKDKTS